MTHDPLNEHWRDAFRQRAADAWGAAELDELLRGKQLLVTPANAPLLLRVCGLLRSDGTMPPAQRRKFFQLNHMLRLLRPPLDELRASGRPLQLVDAGCGLAYLTLALAWCFENVWNHQAQVLGIDFKPSNVASCQERAAKLALGNVRFLTASLTDVGLPDAWQKTFGEPLQLDAVLALHACDTATDDAILLGAQHRAQLIAVAPCCHAELAARWAQLETQDGFAPIRTTPHLRREAAATVTDALRALLLQAAGYETRTVEFVGSEHTPKNTLIRATRGEEPRGDLHTADALAEATGGANISLADRLVRLGLLQPQPQ